MVPEFSRGAVMDDVAAPADFTNLPRLRNLGRSPDQEMAPSVLISKVPPALFSNSSASTRSPLLRRTLPWFFTFFLHFVFFTGEDGGRTLVNTASQPGSKEKPPTPSSTASSALKTLLMV